MITTFTALLASEDGTIATMPLDGSDATEVTASIETFLTEYSHDYMRFIIITTSGAQALLTLPTDTLWAHVTKHGQPVPTQD